MGNSIAGRTLTLLDLARWLDEMKKRHDWQDLPITIRSATGNVRDMTELPILKTYNEQWGDDEAETVVQFLQ